MLAFPKQFTEAIEYADKLPSLNLNRLDAATGFDRIVLHTNLLFDLMEHDGEPHT